MPRAPKKKLINPWRSIGERDEWDFTQLQDQQLERHYVEKHKDTWSAYKHKYNALRAAKREENPSYGR